MNSDTPLDHTDGVLTIMAGEAFDTLKLENMEERTIDFEKEILDVVNPIGRFQLMAVAWSNFAVMLPAMSVMFFIFGGANPGYICHVPVQNHTQQNQTMVYSLVDNFNWTVNSSSQLNVCFIKGTGCVSRHYTGSYTSVITEWDLVCEKKIYNVLINTALMVGMFIGALIFGYLSDVYGRKSVIFPALAALMICQFVLAFVKLWPLFLVVRFFVGVFAGGTHLIAFLIPIEALNNKWRTLCTAVLGWPLGVALLVLLAYLISDWRYLAMASTLGGLPGLAGFLLIPESPRWLIQKGRFAEAEVVLRRIARMNGRPEPDYSLLPQICASSQRDAARTKAYTFIDVFRTRQQTVYFCVMCLFLFSGSASYYGISMNLPTLSGDIYINTLILALMEIPFYLSTTVTSKSFGRRRAAAGYLLLGAVALFSLLLTRLASPSSALTYFQTTLCLFGRASVGGAWCMVRLVNAEIFPTLIRNIAEGGVTTIGRFGGVAAPYIAYLAVVHPSLPYVVYGLLALLAAIFLLLFLPETKGHSLPDSVPEWTDHCFPCCRSRYNDVPLKEKPNVEVNLGL